MDISHFLKNSCSPQKKREKNSSYKSALCMDKLDHVSLGSYKTIYLDPKVFVHHMYIPHHKYVSGNYGDYNYRFDTLQ